MRLSKTIPTIMFIAYGFFLNKAIAANAEPQMLKTLQPHFRSKIVKLLVLARRKYPTYKIIIAETYRSQARQDILFAEGRSVTQVKVSKHTKGLACDIYFTKNDKIAEYEEAPYAQLGKLAESLGIKWGGLWKTLKDYGHFEEE